MTQDQQTTKLRSSRWTLAALGLAGVLFVGSSLGLSRLIDRPEGVERRVVIPEGTARRLAAGEDVALLPADLRFRLRDRLVVVNDDVADHHVGPFVVAPGQTLDKRFSEAATIQGFCSLRASGRISIEIGGV